MRELSTEEIKRIKSCVKSWPQQEQVAFIISFVNKKPKQQAAHDLGLPLSEYELVIGRIAKRIERLL